MRSLLEINDRMRNTPEGQLKKLLDSVESGTDEQLLEQTAWLIGAFSLDHSVRSTKGVLENCPRLIALVETHALEKSDQVAMILVNNLRDGDDALARVAQLIIKVFFA